LPPAAQAPQRTEPVREPVTVHDAVMPIEPQMEPAPIKQKELPSPVPPAANPAELERALKDSGLELVQTRPGIQPEPSLREEFVPAKRERRPPPPDIDEPLVQVETVHESTAPKE
jgi:ribonuclease E